MRLIILGAPGAGKGTQAQRIAKELSVVHISTGDLLRKAVSGGTELGKKAKSFMDQGQLVPDELVIDMMRERLNQPDVHKGFLLDGYPRSIEQAQRLEKITVIDRVVNLIVDEKVLVQRITNRLSCRGCKAVFNRIDKKPRTEGSCDVCGADLYIRDDDKEETLRKRLDTYHRETAPLIEHYRKKGILKDVLGRNSIEDTWVEVRKALA